MLAMTVVPGQPGSAGIEDVPEPDRGDGALLVRGLAAGVCGTDREIAEGSYGTAPSGDQKLIIGHESLGEVIEAPPGSRFAAGELVVGIVRRPDPVPCPACAAGAWDMCRNDGFGERGIVRLHGYGSERWRLEPDFAVAIPSRLGELGDLAQAGTKRDLVEDLGGHYHAGDAADLEIEVDVVIECTGLGTVVRSAARRLVSGGIICLTGIMNVEGNVAVDINAMNRRAVLNNLVLFGTVNAGRRHWEQAVVALAAADPEWLRALITRRIPLDRWTDALVREPGDIKLVVDLAG